MNITPITTAHDADKPNARTEAALQRLHKAMRDIEAEIETHHGVYPFNHGRITQSELCRRADVKKATLQNPVHKDTTRVEIMAWLDQLAARLSQTRDGTRERVTAVADHLTAQVQRLTLAHQAAQEQLAQAEERIRQLQAELALMRAGTQA
jgi:chromosome segregation ATPase